MRQWAWRALGSNSKGLGCWGLRIQLLTGLRYFNATVPLRMGVFVQNFIGISCTPRSCGKGSCGNLCVLQGRQRKCLLLRQVRCNKLRWQKRWGGARQIFPFGKLPAKRRRRKLFETPRRRLRPFSPVRKNLPKQRQCKAPSKCCTR